MDRFTICAHCRREFVKDGGSGYYKWYCNLEKKKFLYDVVPCTAREYETCVLKLREEGNADNTIEPR